MAEDAKKVESEEAPEMAEEEIEPVAGQQMPKEEMKKSGEKRKPTEEKGQGKKEEAEKIKEKEAEPREAEKKEEEEKEEEEFVEERLYTIPLRRYLITPPKRKAKRASKVIRTYIQKHMKPEGIKISEEVNLLLWSRGAENPPPRIRIKALKDKEGVITVRLAEGEK